LHRICQRVHPRLVARLGSGLVLAAALACNACGKRDSLAKREPREVFARGDHVVAEQAAAQFFEGRVLAADGDHLRVQAVGGNDSLNVLGSDVYRLPPPAHELSPNQLAICGRDADWVPCRLSDVSGDSLHASSPDGGAFDVARDRVLFPSALTELNLKRHFTRSQAELAFLRSAQRAGEPRPEPSWRPGIHERVLVKRGSDWFTGYVRELSDEGAEVTLSTIVRNVVVPLGALAADPPSSFVSELRHGDFVLVRPDTPSDPWPRWQVRAVNGAEIKLVDAAGSTRSASVREVVPLRP
ncbi:MAG: hypothetical protein ABW061_08465, partial [Polyangiaceae bacterium]